MIKTRERKIIGDILSRKGRTVLVVVSIMIGVMGVGTLVGMNDLFLGGLKADLNADSIAMTHAYVVAPGGKFTLEDNQGFLERLEGLQSTGITRVEGQAIYPVSWRPANADGDAQFIDGNILSYTEPFENVQLEPISQVVDGRFPQTGQNEVAVEQRFAEENELVIGDKLIFRQTGDGGEPATEWEIVGLVFHPYFTIAPALSDNVDPRDNIFATYEDAQTIADFPGLSSFYARYTDVDAARDDLNDFLEAVGTQTPYIPVFSFIDDPDDSFIVGQVEQVVSVLNILAGVSMAVSGFLVANVINTIVVEQKRHIGVMKSLGATRWDNIYMYGLLALIYGIAGTILGIAIAIPAAFLLARLLTGAFPFTIIDSFTVSPIGVVVAVVMGLLVPVIAALIPVISGTKVSILDAITDYGISSDWGKSRLSRLIGRLPLPITSRQALSNIAQKKGRLALTGGTLALAVAAFMGVTGVFVSLSDYLDGIFDTFNYDIEVAPQQGQDFEQIRNLITTNIDGVEDVFPGYGVAVSVEGYESTQAIDLGSDQLNAFGVDPRSPVIQFDVIEGSGWQDDPDRSGIMLSRPLADQLEKGVGDSLQITVRGQSHEFEIIGIDSFPFEFMWLRWDELAEIAGFVDETNQPLPGSFFVSLSGDLGIEEVDAVIADLTDIMVANGIQATYINQPENVETQTQGVTVFSLIFNMTSGVMALVGAIGLLATLSMAVFERQKEIGVMRSIGAGSRTIVAQFLTEGVIVGIIAWMVGLPLSILLSAVLIDALDFGQAFEFAFPLAVLGFGLIGMIIIAAIASFWPSVSASRKTVADILRYQ